MCQCFHDIYVTTVPDELITWRPRNDGTPSISTLSLASSHSSIHSEATQQIPNLTTPNSTTPTTINNIDDNNNITSTDTQVGTVTNDAQSKDMPPSSDVAPLENSKLCNKAVSIELSTMGNIEVSLLKRCKYLQYRGFIIQ